MTEYPEHEKLKKISDQSNAIGAFIDTSGYTLCKWHDGDESDDLGEMVDGSDLDGLFLPDHKSIERVLADYFDIDLDAIDREKRAMLDAARAAA